jgi:hypothetical protein
VEVEIKRLQATAVTTNDTTKKATTTVATAEAAARDTAQTAA